MFATPEVKELLAYRGSSNLPGAPVQIMGRLQRKVLFTASALLLLVSVSVAMYRFGYASCIAARKEECANGSVVEVKPRAVYAVSYERF